MASELRSRALRESKKQDRQNCRLNSHCGRLDQISNACNIDAAAEALAAAMTQADVCARPVTMRQLRMVRPGILEVWVSN